MVEQDQVRENLNKLDVHKSVGPGGMQSHVLRELTNVSVIFEKIYVKGIHTHKYIYT